MCRNSFQHFSTPSLCPVLVARLRGGQDEEVVVAAVLVPISAWVSVASPLMTLIGHRRPRRSQPMIRSRLRQTDVEVDDRRLEAAQGEAGRNWRWWWSSPTPPCPRLRRRCESRVPPSEKRNFTCGYRKCRMAFGEPQLVDSDSISDRSTRSRLPRAGSAPVAPASLSGDARL